VALSPGCLAICLAGWRGTVRYQLEASNREPIDECWATLFEVWRPAGFQYHLDLHTMGNILNNPFAYYHHTFYDETDPSFTKVRLSINIKCPFLFSLSNASPEPVYENNGLPSEILPPTHSGPAAAEYAISMIR